jgi:hypothetical protein
MTGIFKFQFQEFWSLHVIVPVMEMCGVSKFGCVLLIHVHVQKSFLGVLVACCETWILKFPQATQVYRNVRY